jgi:penicillin V acylase-like amidase (Ntn superfamily)
MCTALAYKTKDFYFGRTLDYESSYGEEIVITPRQYPFAFRNGAKRNEHYALIGMAHVAGGYPLYYEAVNEKGLGMAGLNFVGNACYGKEKEGKDNIASFELIPWILGQCSTVKEVRELLEKINVTNLAFHESFPVSPLHWLIADEKETITVEAVEEGLFVYDNPVGVLTNNPPFPQQMFQLNNYMHLSPKQPKNLFSERLKLQTYSRGMGALGLPGDLSSASRFVRAAFTKLNAIATQKEEDSVGQFFHIMGTVEQSKGCCEVNEGAYEYTIYTSCCNASKGIYYYTTYFNHQINAVDMHEEDLDGKKVVVYPVLQEETIHYQNKTQKD